jgi:hypothetical protein
MKVAEAVLTISLDRPLHDIAMISGATVSAGGPTVVILIPVPTRTAHGSTILDTSYSMHSGCVSNLRGLTERVRIPFTSDNIRQSGLVLHSFLVLLMHMLVLLLSVLLLELPHAPRRGTGGDDGWSERVERFLENCVDLL